MDPLCRIFMGPAQDNSVAIIRNDTTKKGSSGEAGIDPVERARRKKLEIGKPSVEVTPDLADIALRDASSGKVMKARRGSRKDSLLGGMEFATPPMGNSSLLGG